MEIKVKVYSRSIGVERLEHEPAYRADVFIMSSTCPADYHAVADTPQEALRLVADLWVWSEKPVAERGPRQW